MEDGERGISLAWRLVLEFIGRLLDGAAPQVDSVDVDTLRWGLEELLNKKVKVAIYIALHTSTWTKFSLNNI